LRFVFCVSNLFADLLAYFDIYFHTDSRGTLVYSPPILRVKGTRIEHYYIKRCWSVLVKFSSV